MKTTFEKEMEASSLLDEFISSLDAEIKMAGGDYTDVPSEDVFDAAWELYHKVKWVYDQ